MTISTLPTAPLITDTPAVFNTRAFALVGALATFVTETNADVVIVNAKTILATDYAQKTDAYVTGSDNSAKSWAIGGTSTGAPSLGDAKSWATKDTTAVYSGLYSAKEYASGDATASGGSAKAWAIDTASPDGTTTKSSLTLATEAAVSAGTATTQATLSTNYAQKTDAYITGTDNSSKSWAIGGTGTGQPAAGDAKSWATQLTTAIASALYSSKEYASGDATASGGSAKAWATDASSPDGTSTKSAKTWADEASASAASAAAMAAAFVGTSTTSWTPAVGSKTFITQTAEQYTAGIFVTIVSAASPTAFGYGQVTSYSGNSLVVDIQVISGSGVHTDWDISLAGVRGATGATGAYGGEPWIIKTSGYTAAHKNRIAVDTTTAGFSIALPASPLVSDYVEFCDVGRTLATNNLTVTRNSSTIGGLAEDMTVSTTGASFGMIYSGSTWQVYGV